MFTSQIYKALNGSYQLMSSCDRFVRNCVRNKISIHQLMCLLDNAHYKHALQVAHVFDLA